MSLSDMEFQQRKAEKKIRQQMQEEKALYRRVFDTPHGRAVLNDIMGMGAVFATTFDGEVYRSTHLEGRRSLALDIVNKVVEADINILTKALQEGATDGRE